MTEPIFRVLDHTADVAIEAEADDLDVLFACCAAGMFSLVVEGEPAAAMEERSLALAAHDLPELLVAWLRELLWWQNERGWVFAGSRFQVLEPTRLEATVAGEIADAVRLRVVRELKAVTYHDLVAEERGDGWYARILFDV